MQVVVVISSSSSPPPFWTFVPCFAPCPQSPTFLAPGTCFMEDNFSHELAWGDGLGMIQMHYIYFYYYYSSSTSDHQALDPGGWGPLPEVIPGVLRTGSQWGGQILGSGGLAPQPSLSSLHWLCDLREKLLFLTRLGGGCHHLLSQGRELQLGEGADTRKAPSLGLGSRARDAEKRGGCFSSLVFGSEGHSVYSTALSCTNVPTLGELSGKGKSTARNAATLLLCQGTAEWSVNRHHQLPLAPKAGDEVWCAWQAWRTDDEAKMLLWLQPRK